MISSIVLAIVIFIASTFEPGSEQWVTAMSIAVIYNAILTYFVWRNYMGSKQKEAIDPFETIMEEHRGDEEMVVGTMKGLFTLETITQAIILFMASFFIGNLIFVGLLFFHFIMKGMLYDRMLTRVESKL